jgi:hypothetical protein
MKPRLPLTVRITNAGRFRVMPQLRAVRFDLRARCRRRPLIDPGGLCDVMMTSYGRRLRRVYLALESIGAGSCRPHTLTLAVADERFVKAPPRLVRRQVGRGLRVVLVADHRSHKKYYPYVAGRSEFDRPLVTSDDDLFYPRTWLEELQAEHRRHPDDIVAHSAAHIILDGQVAPFLDWPRVTSTDASLLHFAEGGAGALHPPAQLMALKSAGPAFVDTCLSADDIWLNVTALRNDIRVRTVTDVSRRLRAIPRRRDVRLWDTNRLPAGNDAMIAATYGDGDIQKLVLEAQRNVCACRL